MRTITCFGDRTSGTYLIIMYIFMYVCMHAVYIHLLKLSLQGFSATIY